ncbi:nuclear transport factor 2 family protein [Streptomyces sp. NPDC086554]|uniref:ester cyclase n=1 Tax=Streptomyces sp. NPDC086554 TaxID=3154864 RepID=UPI003428032B
MRDIAERTAFLEDWVAALNVGAEEVVTFYTEETLYEERGIKVAIRGRENLRQFYRQLYPMFSNLAVTTRKSIVTADHAVVEWTMSGTLIGKIPEVPAPSSGEAPFSFEGASILEFADDGRIAREAAYWSVADLIQQISAPRSG